MSTVDCLNACAKAGYRINRDAGTVSGVIDGVAFRLTPETAVLELSVNLPNKRLPKLQQAWEPQCPGLTVTPGDGCLVRLTCPGIADWPIDQLQAFLGTVSRDAVSGAERSFNDRHEKERDPVSAYLRGFVGALGGALVGALPWFLVRLFIGWDTWYLLGLIGIASFYGYRLLWGAHSTRYAWTLIVVFSLFSVLLLSLGEQVWTVNNLLGYYAEISGNWSLLDANLWDILRFCLTDSTIQENTLQRMLLPLLLCAAGLAGIRRQITVYTHESAFLRRGRRRK